MNVYDGHYRSKLSTFYEKRIPASLKSFLRFLSYGNTLKSNRQYIILYNNIVISYLVYVVTEGWHGFVNRVRG